MVRLTRTGQPVGDDRPANTGAGSGAVASLHDRVAFVIDRIRPAVQNDGGDIEFIEVTKAGLVRIKMHGACVGCPSSNMTLRMGIERNLKEHIPEVTGVEAVSDH